MKKASTKSSLVKREMNSPDSILVKEQIEKIGRLKSEIDIYPRLVERENEIRKKYAVALKKPEMAYIALLANDAVRKNKKSNSEDLGEAIKIGREYQFEMSTCHRMMVALQLDFFPPDLGTLVFETAVELSKLMSLLENGKPTQLKNNRGLIDPFEEVFDRMPNSTGREVAIEFLDSRHPREKNRLIREKGGGKREEAIKKLIRKCEYIRRKRKLR